MENTAAVDSSCKLHWRIRGNGSRNSCVGDLSRNPTAQRPTLRMVAWISSWPNPTMRPPLIRGSETQQLDTRPPSEMVSRKMGFLKRQSCWTRWVISVLPRSRWQNADFGVETTGIDLGMGTDPQGLVWTGHCTGLQESWEVLLCKTKETCLVNIVPKLLAGIIFRRFSSGSLRVQPVSNPVRVASIRSFLWY